MSISLQTVRVLLHLREMLALFRQFEATSHLQLKLFPHSVLFVGLDDDMKIVEVFDDEVVPLIHRQENLLDRRIA